MKLPEKLNGTAKPISIGTVTGLVVAAIAFLTLHLTLSDRLRREGGSAENISQRVHVLEMWVADYERNVRPLRDEFLRLTGQLKRLPDQIDDLKIEMRRLNDRLDKLERRLP